MQMGIGDTVFAGGVGRIVESTVEGWDVGRAVRGPLGAQSFSKLSIEHLELLEESNLPLSVNLGILGGSTGVTAYPQGVPSVRPLPCRRSWLCAPLWRAASHRTPNLPEQALC